MSTTENNVSAGRLISKMKESFGDLTKKECKEIFDFLVNEIKGTLAKGGKVSIAGFGSFSVAHRQERNGHNPSTQEAIVIPACKRAKFDSYSDLKKLVNN